MRRNSQWLSRSATGVAVLLTPASALANAGWPAAWVGMSPLAFFYVVIPSLVIEIAIIARMLRMTVMRAVAVALIANAASFLVGLAPLALSGRMMGPAVFGSAIVTFTTLQKVLLLATGVIPEGPVETMTVYAVAYYFVLSVAVEWVMLRMLPWFRAVSHGRLFQVVLLTNGVTYLLLAAIAMVMFRPIG